ncbi:cellulase family glycosylhydrolase [Salinimicrobium soli]|uniref:cellulase family glycosylhydrolase n=1 Tax=Salinimicrobium soli TaxID=1254399 RepID=UPI003AABB4C5
MNQYFKPGILVLFSTFLLCLNAYSQEGEDVYVNDKGIMYWSGTNEEVKGFGVNYTAPFAHAFRTAKRMDVDLKKAIDDDIYHFSRLGFDLYRIHVWDTEISDEKGNLLENEHLDLFDYLLSRLKEKNIKFMITPIAYWGNGWPEPDEDTPGFAHKYGKDKSLTDPEAIKAQENYLAQFVNHINPYTGVAYKDEPFMIGYEVSNEPHHRESPEKVNEFIQKMVAAIRSTGTKKPIFYNVSHSIQLAKTYAESGIQGGTFQWYPTGLGFAKELEGNLLPNVNEYRIPFVEMWQEKGLAKLVYEFDAADVMKTYMYPAMARSFRQAGIQFATHFAYDPTFMAYANTEYNTHYMNLAYTPGKAIALMISGEVFHRLPMYKDLGKYPQNLIFGDFRISYEQDLAEMNSEEKFLYTNSTETRPKALKKLKQVAGVGNSPLVQYEGNGAYFLDKLDENTWRLEVMPDAILVGNPFGRNSPEKTVAVINHREWPMHLDLPGLGGDFRVSGLNAGNTYSKMASEGSFSVSPGTYLISRGGREFKGSKEWPQERLTAFVAPETTVDRTYVLHEPLKEITPSSEANFSAEIISDEKIEKVEAWFRNGNSYESAELEWEKAYTYVAEIPKGVLKKGFLEYRIIVRTEKSSFTFPAGVEGNPGEWDFYANDSYSTRIVEPEAPIYLFNAFEDADYVVGQWSPGNNLIPTDKPGEAEYQVNLEQLFKEDPENTEAAPIYDYSLRYNFEKRTEGRELKNWNKLVIKAHAAGEKAEKLQVAFINEQGKAFGTTIDLQPRELQEYEIALSELQPVKTVTLPRPYPTFLPYYFDHALKDDFKLEEMESLQFSIGPGLKDEELKTPHAIGIVSVRLEK